MPKTVAVREVVSANDESGKTATKKLTVRLRSN